MGLYIISNYRIYPHKSNVVDGWLLPFLGADRDVAKRSQRYFYEYESQRPVQVDTYFIVKSIFYVIGFVIFGGIFALMTQFKFSRNLLLNVSI